MDLKLFPSHAGVWEGTYTRLDPQGKVLDHHSSRLTMLLQGQDWRQTNEYKWEDGKHEFHNFGIAQFDNEGVMTFDNPRIFGKAWESEPSIMLWWTYKDEPGSKLFEIITMIEDGHRMRTWQHSRNGVFEGLTMIEERQVKKMSEISLADFPA